MIKSLSKSEKRQFMLSTKKQAGGKDYLYLFDLIDAEDFPQMKSIEAAFSKRHPGSSVNNAARYLEKLVTDSLVQSKVKDDHAFRLMHGLMRVNVLAERNLQEESYRELKKLEELATASQHYFFLPLIQRVELNYLADSNFANMAEKELVEKQMKTRETLKTMRDTHELYSLFELLKFRLTHSGKVMSDEGRRQLNDLLLSEVGLVTGRIRNNFESGKLHLMFQSFFFTDIGDYRSALKTFHELNRLFEQNTAIWGHPPLDYLFSLDGILDSLRTVGLHQEMRFYIDKISRLSQPEYPEHFCFLTEKLKVIYDLAIMTDSGQYSEALAYVQKVNPLLFKMHTLVHYEKQWELLFYFAKTYFGVRDFSRAQKQINAVVLIGKINYQSTVYRAAMLLNLIIHYEFGNREYLEYEVRSNKRALRAKGKMTKTEALIFKVIGFNPARNRTGRNQQWLAKITPTIHAVEADKYEMQLRKYFDFTGWIKEKLGYPTDNPKQGLRTVRRTKKNSPS